MNRHLSKAATLVTPLSRIARKRRDILFCSLTRSFGLVIVHYESVDNRISLRPQAKRRCVTEIRNRPISLGLTIARGPFFGKIGISISGKSEKR